MTSLKADEILEVLRKKGSRITKVRKQIIEIMSAAASPLSAQDIIARLAKKSLHPNKTTVYRELQFLKDDSILSEIDLLEGQKRYEIHDPTHHHHHLLCTKCKKIQCIAMDNDLDELEKKILKKHKFRVSGHLLEFFGVCHECS